MSYAMSDAMDRRAGYLLQARIFLAHNGTLSRAPVIDTDSGTGEVDRDKKETENSQFNYSRFETVPSRRNRIVPLFS